MGQFFKTEYFELQVACQKEADGYKVIITNGPEQRVEVFYANLRELIAMLECAKEVFDYNA